MSSIRAGARIKASTLNAIMPVVDRAVGDASSGSNVTGVNASGLYAPVDASATYAVRGYVAYTAATAGDLKLALVAPTGSTGHWGLAGFATTVTGVTGDATHLRAGGFTSADVLSVGGVDGQDLFAAIFGTLVVGSTAGQLQLWRAQTTANATPSVVKDGTWLHLTKIS